jgi:hypothetical protein
MPRRGVIAEWLWVRVAIFVDLDRRRQDQQNAPPPGRTQSCTTSPDCQGNLSKVMIATASIVHLTNSETSASVRLLQISDTPEHENGGVSGAFCADDAASARRARRSPQARHQQQTEGRGARRCAELTERWEIGHHSAGPVCLPTRRRSIVASPAMVTVTFLRPVPRELRRSKRRLQ